MKKERYKKMTVML